MAHTLTAELPTVADVRPSGPQEPVLPRREADVPQRISFRRIALAWLAIASIAGLQTATQLAQLPISHVPWPLLGLTFVGWLMWAALTPAIIAVARRFPVQRGTLARALVVHFLVSAVCVVLIAVAWDTLAAVALATTPGGASGLRQVGFPRLLDLLSPVGHAMVGLLTYASIVAAVTILDNRDRTHRAELAAAKLQLDLASAREQVIRKQVHPHFLFNTLHSISLMVLAEPRVAHEMVVHLSDFLRATLARANRSEVTLREELDLIDNYLEIEHLRFGDRLQVSVDADTETLDALVPDLVLQPLVENAVKHGVAKRPGTTRLEIRAIQNGDALVVTIQDDADGPAPQVRDGVGLRTTRQRLEQLYGATHNVTVEPRPEGGTCVTVTLPFHRESDADAAVITDGADDDY